MSAMIYDTTSQAFVEAETPMKFDTGNQSWADTTGLAYNPEAGAWEEKWSASKGFKGYLMKNGVLQIPNEYSYIYLNNDSNWRTGSFSWTHQFDSSHSLLRVSTTYCNGIVIQFKEPIVISAGSRLHTIAKRPNWQNRVGWIGFMQNQYSNGENLQTKSPVFIPTDSDVFCTNTGVNNISVDTEFVSAYSIENATGYLCIRNALQETSGTVDFLIKDIWIE